VSGPAWASHFGEAWTSPEAVAARVPTQATLATGLIEPTTILEALAQREDSGGEAWVAVAAMGALALGQTGRFKLVTCFASPVYQALEPSGVCQYLPALFSDAERIFRELKPDCILLRLAPPDAQGLCSYGWASAFSPHLFESARAAGISILAEIDPAMPWTRSGMEVPASEVTAACLAAGQAAIDEPGEASRNAQKVGAHLEEFVPDGATLQVGIGSVPDAAVSQLGAQRLGIHTEVLSRGLARLVASGQADGSEKSEDKGLAVCTIASVDPEVRALVEDPARAEVRASSRVLDPRVIARHDKLRCINSAMAVDLRGQVNAETLGWSQVAGVGGQLDFFRGAGLRDDALRIIVLGSTTSGGESRIVVSHPPGAVVTATRYDIDLVVTEHGSAWLRNQTDEARARALIEVAEPAHREALTRSRFGA
jgi:4-hydroxybutyrate CoA-transferase